MIWIFVIYLCVHFRFCIAVVSLDNPDLPRELSKDWMNHTRRIMRGNDASDTRPYMVYLRPAMTASKEVESNWLCGGVIIDERYILTSAACIEDVKHFYVISGTHTWVTPKTVDNECVNNGAKKAIWKCVPKSYVFDGNDIDNIRWMMNDIAVVKVEDDFNFKRRVKGCDFVPSKIAYNNKSKELEKAGTLASIAGWGSVEFFSDVVGSAARSSVANNSERLLDTDVTILSKKNCKKRWAERYHDVIEKYMICGKDGMDAITMSIACAENEVNCKELNYSDEDEDDEFDDQGDQGDQNQNGNAENKNDNKDGTRRKMQVLDPSENKALRGGYNNRRTKPISGGFCENDHGGPLVVGHGKTAVVIGVISATQVREKTNQCFGPFLYTSVYNNRHVISCAINKEMGSTCRSVLRAARTQMSETIFSWKGHPEGPAKSEH